MAEKRFKVNIKDGNVNIETISGFNENQCHSTVEAVVGGLGLNAVDGGDKDALPTDDPNVFVKF